MQTVDNAEVDSFLVAPPSDGAREHLEMKLKGRKRWDRGEQRG